MPSLRARVTVSAGLVLAIFIALTGLTLDRAFRESARSARHDRLLGQTYLLMAAAELDPRGRLILPDALSEARFGQPGSGLYGVITDGRAVVWRSPSTLGVEVPYVESLAAGEERFEERRGGRQPYFLVGYGVQWAGSGRPSPFTFTVAEDLSGFDAQIVAYRRSLWGGLGAMAVLLLAALGAVLGWGLRPLGRVAAEVAAIESGQQDRIAGRYPSEIARLTDNLNALLRQERAQQKRYREALADLAHSLKTPLAVLRSARVPGQSPAVLEAAVEEQVARMASIVDYQLQRAAAAGRSRFAAPVPVAPLARKVAASLDKVYRDKGVETTLALADDLVFRGDEGDLLELFGNLLDNAYKWCRRVVAVSGAREGGALLLTIADDGPGIDAAAAARLTERGVRADSAVPGHGIGLAVVRDIVTAYDGDLAIGESPLGGASVTLRLPA